MELKKMIESLSQEKKGNLVFYQFDKFRKVLQEEANFSVEDDIIFVPFYAQGTRLLELYDYELRIVIKEEAESEKYILLRTGKESMSQVKSDIIDKFRNCYIEIINPNNVVSSDRLIRYIEYIECSTELKERIEKLKFTYKKENFYFELY